MKLKKLALVFLALALCLGIVILMQVREEKGEEIVFGGAKDGKTRVVKPETLPDPKTTPEPEDDGVVWPDLTLNEMLEAENRQYAIVNDKNLLSAAFQPECDVIEGTNGKLFEKSALPYLEAMLQDLRDHGFTPYVDSAYRTYSSQEIRFNGTASDIADRMDPPPEDYLDPRYQEAVAVARTITAYPGSSEHQLGLGVDILDRPRSNMNYDAMDKEFFNYLDSICAKYGFIKRYPNTKLPLTGWNEPWHYRYVGVEAATFIMEHGICYEEFYAHYDPEFSIK